LALPQARHKASRALGAGRPIPFSSVNHLLADRNLGADAGTAGRKRDRGSTPMTTTTDFAGPAEVWQAITIAKMHDQLQVVPEPAVLTNMIGILVSLGILTPEQARELQKLLDHGVLYPLPPVPRPDQVAGKVDLYQVLRVATLVPREQAEFDIIDDAITIIGGTLANLLAGPVADAISDVVDAVGSWLTGLFS
jgi:hypothetical protein